MTLTGRHGGMPGLLDPEVVLRRHIVGGGDAGTDALPCDPPITSPGPRSST